ncbi:MAG: deoxyribonuclease IV [Aquificaceae bacterium]|nr:MAG: deoxyribonuclease IV [Aquificaceae bacterium]
MYIGAHVPIAGGVEKAPINAKNIGATAFALFLKNQRRWFDKPYPPERVRKFKENVNKLGFCADCILPHAGYLINLCSPDREKAEKSFLALLDEVERAHRLGLKYVNFHPGAHLGKYGEREALKIIAERINQILDKTEGVTLVLETTAGQGSNLGYRFEHLAQIIELVEDKSRIGVCIDTCHIFAAGYDISTEKGFLKTMEEFEKVIGFEYLKGVHLNDSKTKLGSRKDRHAPLGEGYIGLTPFRLIVNDERFKNVPLILETPDPTRWPEEIKLLRSFAEN